MHGAISPVRPTPVWRRHILYSFTLHRNLYTVLYKPTCRTSVTNMCKSIALTWTAYYRYSYLPDNGALLGCHATSSGNFSPTFRESISVPSLGVNNPSELQDVLHASGKIFLIYELLDSFGFLTLEDGTDGLFRNVGKELPQLAA
jgi:hypothetical protein